MLAACLSRDTLRIPSLDPKHSRSQHKLPSVLITSMTEWKSSLHIARSHSSCRINTLDQAILVIRHICGIHATCPDRSVRLRLIRHPGHIVLSAVKSRVAMAPALPEATQIKHKSFLTTRTGPGRAAQTCTQAPHLMPPSRVMSFQGQRSPKEARLIYRLDLVNDLATQARTVRTISSLVTLRAGRLTLLLKFLLNMTQKSHSGRQQLLWPTSSTLSPLPVLPGALQRVLHRALGLALERPRISRRGASDLPLRAKAIRHPQKTHRLLEHAHLRHRQVQTPFRRSKNLPRWSLVGHSAQ
jgi:hypothetical protein